MFPYIYHTNQLDVSKYTIHAWNPKKPFVKWMFGETAICLIKIWNHPTETTIKTWMFRVPGGSYGSRKAPG